jgi:hypothetical protein
MLNATSVDKAKGSGSHLFAKPGHTPNTSIVLWLFSGLA